MLERLKVNEERRKKWAKERAKRRRKLPPAPNDVSQINHLPSPFATTSLQQLPSPFAVPERLLPTTIPFGGQPPFLPPIVEDLNDDDHEDPVDVVHVGEDQDDSDEVLSKVAFENQMKRLVGTG